ncbi:hypothetical protein [Altererythrobacter aquiaggeris]|uniref:hypothetical protein n=1 Tax=Aestuarierythrobacter aquiaggeris TaxID=1898396 RepID=UPI003018E113
MRTAIISITGDHADPDKTTSCMEIAGQTLAGRQLGQTLALGAERIICEIDNMSEQVFALQHSAEKAGAKFNTIKHLRDLSGLVTAADEVLVMERDAVFDDDALANWADMGPSIAVFGSDPAVAAGFERIDAEFGWAGVMLLPGRLIEKLFSLPDGMDPVSALLRIALQGGMKLMPLDAALLSDSRWALPQTREQATRLEETMLRRRLVPASVWTPISALSDRIMLATGSKLLGRSFGSARIAAASICTGLLSAMAGWFFAPAIGLAGLSAAFVLAAFSRSIAVMEGGPPKCIDLPSAAVWALEAMLIWLCVMAVAEDQRLNVAFSAIVLLGLLKISEMTGIAPIWKTVRERALLSIILALAVLSEVGVNTLQILGIITLILIGVRLNRAGLTRA